MKFWKRWVLLSSVIFFACVDDVCETHSDCPTGQMCLESGGVLFGGKSCVPQSGTSPEDMDLDSNQDVANNPNIDSGQDLQLTDLVEDIGDIGIEDQDTSADLADAEHDQDTEPCVPQTAAEFCLSHGKTCGEFAATDNCGNARSHDCGTCLQPAVCGGGGTPNTCACATQTDAAFCASNNATCGNVQNTDDCNQLRIVDCGSCTSPLTCGGGGTPNTCGCTAETDADFCVRLGKNCGPATGTDNCGAPRTADCGTCTSPLTCGGGNPGAPNICGCTPETNTTFCSRNGGECGTLLGIDNCGALRTPNCGSCDIQEICQENVCCVPESNSSFCSRFGSNCGSLSRLDNCGIFRSNVDCGTCSGQTVCNANNFCECDPESNSQICSRYGLECGIYSFDNDNCGNYRFNVDCGTCDPTIYTQCSSGICQ